MHKSNFCLSILLVLFALAMFSMVAPQAASASDTQLKDLPLGTVIKDSASWEHKTGDGYTGSGETKPVEWIIVAKNHPGYPANSVTVISKEIIGKYAFDDSTTRGSSDGSNHWGNSGTTNATAGVRTWLNGTFYNYLSQNFKDAILTTTVPNKQDCQDWQDWQSGTSYTTEDKIFLPSATELGSGDSWSYDIGTNWGYFKSDTSRIAQIRGNNWYYWTRSPYFYCSNGVRNIDSSGSLSNCIAYYDGEGVRPALNLKSEIYVQATGEIIGSGTTPTMQSIAITTPATKLSYIMREALDISGLVVTGTYSDSTKKTETITTANISGFNSAVPVANQVLTINVGGKTVTYKIQITAPADSSDTQLKDLPLGSVIKDSASWEHKTGDGYTGSGATKPVEWVIVAKNHPGYPANSVTVISREIIGKYAFDDSTNRGSSYGSNHWGNSGTPNATAGIRPWLNGTFYNHLSQNFKDAILTTAVPNRATGGGTSYTTEDKIFLPSLTELGIILNDWSYDIGTNWGYFKSNTSRIAQIDGMLWHYWTRSPASDYSDGAWNIHNSGGLYCGSRIALTAYEGVRPALNLKSEIYVQATGEIIGSGTTPTLQSIAITTPANKLIYTIGDNLDISGLVVTGTYSDKSTKTKPITAVNITGFNSAVPATDQVLTITVGGKTATYKVQILAAVVNTDITGMIKMTTTSPTTVGSTKEWIIKLIGLVKEPISSDKIYVTNSVGIKQATTCTVISSNVLSQIKVTPTNGYAAGSYTLFVRDIESTKGTKIKNQVYLNFTVQ